MSRRGAPFRLAVKDSRTQVKHAFVPAQFAVAKVERLVLDEQAQNLPVREVDDRLSLFRVAVPRLGVGQRMQFVEAVEVRSRQAERFTLVKVASQSDVAVGQREHGLGLRELLEIERRLPD